MNISFISPSDMTSKTWEQARQTLSDDLLRLQSTLNTLWLIAHNTDGSQTAASLSDPAWIDVPFNAGNYSANSTGSITPHGSNPYVYRYLNKGKSLHFHVSGSANINNVTTTEIRVAIPPGFNLKPYDAVSTTDENQDSVAGIWNNNATAGTTGAFINFAGRYISVQRWDGVAAAGFPNGTNCFFRFQIEIPLN